MGSGVSIRDILLILPVMILSLSVHEWAHAWVANRLGDPTARYLGRMTIDPMVHISWVGTVILPAMMMFYGIPAFGWANPVPVDSRNFRSPRAHMAIVAAAGPASNIILATLLTAILSVIVHTPLSALISKSGPLTAGVEMLQGAIFLNLILAVFNLIPLPPLDGSRIVQGMVSARAAHKIDEFAQISQFVLLAVFLSGMGRVLLAPAMWFSKILYQLFGLN